MPSGPRPRPPTNTIRLSVVGNYVNSTWANIFWLNTTVSATPTPAELGALAVDILDAWASNVFVLQSDAANIDDFKAVFMESPTTEVTSENAYSAAGGVSGAGLPASVSAAISWAISAYYRGGHPKTYMPGLNVADMADAKNLTSTYTNALQAGATAFRNAVNALTDTPFTSVTLGTVSFASGNAWRVTPVFRDYIGNVVHPRADSQRRRLGKELV